MTVSGLAPLFQRDQIFCQFLSANWPHVLVISGPPDSLSSRFTAEWVEIVIALREGVVRNVILQVPFICWSARSSSIAISEVKPMSRIRWIGVSACAALALACGSDPKPPPAAPPAQAAPPPAAPTAQNPKPQDDGGSGQINISDEILKACGIQQSKAMFGFDSAQIQSGDQPVLNKLAECFISGPLKGRAMRLIGHADSRGEPEYNMVLGGRRADNVKSYLVRKALPDNRAETTSRGEMDASGTDEATWASDRRVDITLVN